MSGKNTKKQTHIPFLSLSSELQSHILVKLFLCIIGYICIVIFGVVTGLLKASLYLAIALTFFTFSTLLLLRKALRDEIYFYEGVCLKKVGKEISAKNPLNKKPFFTTWSYCYLLLALNNGSEEIKVEVPCGYSFRVEEGNTVRVYTKNAELCKKNDNTYLINNPLFTVVSKT